MSWKAPREWRCRAGCGASRRYSARPLLRGQLGTGLEAAGLAGRPSRSAGRKALRLTNLRRRNRGQAAAAIMYTEVAFIKHSSAEMNSRLFVLGPAGPGNGVTPTVKATCQGPEKPLGYVAPAGSSFQGTEKPLRFWQASWPGPEQPFGYKAPGTSPPLGPGGPAKGVHRSSHFGATTNSTIRPE